MGALMLPTSGFSGEDEAEGHRGSISQLVSRLRTAFRTADFNLVEEELVAKEAKLKREIKMLRVEKARLEEKQQIEQLEKLKVEEERNAAKEMYETLLKEVKRGVDFDDKDAVFELRWRNSELEIENKRLKAQLNRNYEELEKKIARLEEETAKLMNERRRGLRRIERRSENCGTIFGSENINRSVTSSPNLLATSAPGSPLSDSSNSKGNGDQQAASGIGKVSSGGVIVIDSDDDDDDCAPRDTVWQKKTFGKRKRASSISISDNENGGDNFGQGITPISEMKQHLKSSIEPCSSLGNHCSEAIVASPINDPTSRDIVIVREAEKTKWADQRSQDFIMSLGEGSDDFDSGDSSSSSSSSSDSENGNRGLFSFHDAMEKIKATKECSR